MIDPDLDREYSPSSMVDDINVYLDDYRTQGEAARSAIAHTTLSYGRGPDELIDVFPAIDASLLHVFIHGGYWQALSRRDGSLLAPGIVSHGHHFASVDYTLAPHAKLTTIVDQIVRAVTFAHENIRRADGSRLPMVISGHSAGAHLAAMAALRVDPGTIAGLVLVSGVYDLVPLVETSVNEAVQLDQKTAFLLSPLPRVLARTADAGAAPFANPIETLIVVGEIETDTFKAQSQAFTEAWSQAGHPAAFHEIADRNHFDIVADIADRSTQLGGLVHAQERAIMLPDLFPPDSR